MTRLEGQVLRYKSAAENAEKVEDELKAEKRKLQREVEFTFTVTTERRAGPLSRLCSNLPPSPPPRLLCDPTAANGTGQGR